MNVRFGSVHLKLWSLRSADLSSVTSFVLFPRKVNIEGSKERTERAAVWDICHPIQCPFTENINYLLWLRAGTLKTTLLKHYTFRTVIYLKVLTDLILGSLVGIPLRTLLFLRFFCVLCPAQTRGLALG